MLLKWHMTFNSIVDELHMLNSYDTWHGMNSQMYKFYRQYMYDYDYDRDKECCERACQSYKREQIKVQLNDKRKLITIVMLHRKNTTA